MYKFFHSCLRSWTLLVLCITTYNDSPCQRGSLLLIFIGLSMVSTATSPLQNLRVGKKLSNTLELENCYLCVHNNGGCLELNSRLLFNYLTKFIFQQDRFHGPKSKSLKMAICLMDKFHPLRYLFFQLYRYFYLLTSSTDRRCSYFVIIYSCTIYWLHAGRFWSGARDWREG